MAEIQVKSELAGKVWKIETEIGQALAEEDQILILESMKMEIPLLAPRAGVLSAILVKEGDAVAEGQPVAAISV